MYLGMGAHVVPRGFTLPIDPYTTGTVRYGRKIGYELPLIVPDNKYELAEDAIFQMDRFTVDRAPTWVESGGFVSLGDLELHEVEDVSDTEIVLVTTLLADHPEREPVYHYSNPIEVEGAYAAGQTTINIDAPVFVVVGDVIAISPNTTSTPLAFIEYIVTSVRYVGTTAGINQYQVVLDKVLHRALSDGEVIQLRAYPAYQSRILDIPQAPAALRPVVGPYLVDWVSAPFFNNMNVTEYQTLQRYNAAHVAFGPPLQISKNHFVLHVPIRADQFLFWDKVDGSINFNFDEHKILATLDSDGHWWFKHTCAPEIAVPYTNAHGTIICVPITSLNNNEGFRLDDGIDAVAFEYQIDGTYTPTASAAATGSITVGAMPVGMPADNEYFTLDNGFGTTVTFEFQRTAGFTQAITGSRIVDVQAAALTTDVAVAMETAVNAISALAITGVNVGGTLNLTNDVVSLNGNQAIVLDPLLLGKGWVAVGMAGGTDKVETIDVQAVSTAIEVAQLTSSSINQGGLQITASYPTVAPGIRLDRLVQGTTGNQPITETVLDPGFSVSGMSGGTGGATWHFQITPTHDILLRIRLYPNDWQDYNLTGGVTATIVVSLSPTDETVERIDFLMRGTAGDTILMSDWNINGARVSALQHNYVAHVKGEHNFATTGLWVKPLWPSLEDVQLKFDKNQAFDAGHLRVRI
jgi:hypothetical protein